jgi:hypothetical protein
LFSGTKVDALSESDLKDSKGDKPSFESEDTLQTPGASPEEKVTITVKVSETPGFAGKSEDIQLQTLDSLATIVKGKPSSLLDFAQRLSRCFTIFLQSL